MATRTLKIQCIHGLGDHRESTWKEDWKAAIVSAFPASDQVEIDFDFIEYDDIFADTNIDAFEAGRAVFKLAQSGIGSIFRRRRGVVADISRRIRWTAGYVVAWVEDEDFQKATRKRVLDSLKDYKPDIVIAHSLGSLITYNAFTHPDANAMAAVLKKINYVTLGSQIGNPFVVGNLTFGRIQPLDVKFWHHLYNRHDDVFTAPISLPEASNFLQTNTPFDVEGIADHYAPGYLTSRNAIESVWRPLIEQRISRAARSLTAPMSKSAKRSSKRRSRRALLVGINDYPNAADRLEGCVNDVFTMSSVLQSAGFEPETIRTCLDERATAKGILDRMKWLVDDPQPGDERVFYFSGHGAQIPEYGEDFEPDRHMETLVPWDFDWSAETAVTDDQIYELYSQLPYDLRLVMIFDCCHAGSMHRNGAARVRGLDPPDDIRHRELKWDRKTRMWVSRKFKRLNKDFSEQKAVSSNYFGKDGATVRLGRASILRGMSDSQYRRARKTRGGAIVGPYLPLIIQACQENEYSYEYRHGVTSHGAFTYCFSKLLEKNPSASFQKLVKHTSRRLKELQYDQVPDILGPTAIQKAPISW